MRQSEVLNAIPGLRKADLQHWEAYGYISPRLIPKKKIAHRDYGPAFDKIQLMWEFHQLGVSPAEASDRADAVLLDKPLSLRRLGEQARSMVRFGPVSGAAAPGAVNWTFVRPETSETWLSSPINARLSGDALEKLSNEPTLAYTSNHLRLLADALMDVLLPEIDALAALSPKMAVVAGAVAIQALQSRERPLSSHYFDTSTGTAVLTGAPTTGAMTLALLIESWRDTSAAIDAMDESSRTGWMVSQIVGIVGKRGDSEPEGRADMHWSWLLDQDQILDGLE